MIQFASPNGFVAVMPQGIGIDGILYHFIFLTHEGKRKIEAVSDLERGRKALPVSLHPPVHSFIFLLLNFTLPEKEVQSPKFLNLPLS
jgi:hypothetical protein